MKQVIELGDPKCLDSIDLSSYTSFFGEVDGVFYPYIEVDYDPGYSCGRCSGPCPNDIPSSTSLKVVIWEPDQEETRKTSKDYCNYWRNE